MQSRRPLQNKINLPKLDTSGNVSGMPSNGHSQHFNRGRRISNANQNTVNMMQARLNDNLQS